ncbi:hypothetical protein A3Q56_05086 [Intoshia linei]|uniref:glutamine synthetase n=1 Tax=Intoshia linei TaxID=1819745 RepID=A0A177AYU2_9BILA|nr:hypothetical protein A3Q56_05086 [Intoshia linei]
MCTEDSIDMSTHAYYMDLDQGQCNIIATYVWIDGSGENVRGKSKTIRSTKKNISIEDFPIWNFDGSSTGQASGLNSDVYLHPIAVYNDPFFRGNNKLVMCATYDYENRPTSTNHRDKVVAIMDQVREQRPWFGIEQEYTMLSKNKKPLGWPDNGFPGPQGPYYCAAGQGNVYGRAISDSHYKACLYAGLTVSGTNAEVMPGQWEYQIGPVEGIAMGDQLWISRYILQRVAEDFDVGVSLDPKIVPGDWNGSGAHCNYSTKRMRERDGIRYIEDAIKKLSLNHDEHIKEYDPNQGKDNARRLTGLHETASIDKFSSGVANRSASIRIPRQCSYDGFGYLEDRRPSSNCDPYKVTGMLVKTTCF